MPEVSAERRRLPAYLERQPLSRIPEEDREERKEEMKIDKETIEYLNLSCGKIRFFLGVKRDKFGTKYTVYLGTLKKWRDAGDEVVFTFRAERYPSGEFPVFHVKDHGRIGHSLYNLALGAKMPYKAYWHLYRQLCPLRVPQWDERLRRNVIVCRYMIPRGMMKIEREVFSMLDIPDEMKSF